MRLRIAAIAEAEAKDASQWYDDQQPGLGKEFLDELTDALRQIEEHPRRFARLQTPDQRREFRLRLLARFPYSLIYEVLPDEAVVLAVAHVSRRPNYWIGRTGSP